MQTRNIFPRENWKHGWKTRNAVSESGCVCRVLGVLFEDIWGWCRPKHLSPHKSFKSSPMPGKGVSTRRRRNVSLFSDGQVLKTDGIKKKKERKKRRKERRSFHTAHAPLSRIFLRFNFLLSLRTNFFATGASKCLTIFLERIKKWFLLRILLFNPFVTLFG